MSRLKRSKFERIDKYLSNLGSLVGLYYGNIDANETKVYSTYVDVANLISQIICSPGWTKANIKNL